MLGTLAFLEFSHYRISDYRNGTPLVDRILAVDIVAFFENQISFIDLQFRQSSHCCNNVIAQQSTYVTVIAKQIVVV